MCVLERFSILRRIVFIFLFLLTAAAFSPAAFAQTIPEDSAIPATAADDDLALDQLEAALPAHLRTPLPIKNREVAVPNDDASKPAAQPASAIESFYRELTGDLTLAQFGYGFFAKSDQADTPAVTGTTQDDYVLGAGDRLMISFLGERKDRRSYVIDRSGTLAIDLLPPVAATGKTLGTLRDDLRRMLDMQSFHGDVYISLENIRQIGVLVAGHVAQPGRLSLSPLQTALEALEGAGGVLKTGSLRQIRLVRAGQSQIIDLYGIINASGARDSLPPLREGDRIIVPALGPTVTVSGDVRQPGIYELPPEETLRADDALALAGGALASGQNRLTLTTPQNDGRRTARIVDSHGDVALGDGAVLSVVRTVDLPAASFTLQGETRNAGTFPLAQYRKLSDILRRRQSFGDDIYPLLGVISRRAAQGLGRELVAFSPQDVYTGHADMSLADGDLVTLLSRREVRDVLHTAATTVPATLDPLVATFVREHAISLQGAIRLPGLWPVAGPVPVSKILDVAGGTLRDADPGRTEINRNDVGLPETASGVVPHRDVVDLSAAGADTITVTFGDAVRVPDRFEAVTRQTVTLLGEVRNPGAYDLMRGDTLLTLIDRAGGLTDQGYPPGTIFSRAAERRREKERYNAAARDLERAIAVAAQQQQDKSGKIDTAQIALARDLVSEVERIDPVGRITVEADPAVLRRDPAQDILLESGDRIYIPKRPLTVRVTGEVLSPAALQFRADKKTNDYIAEAGGLTINADRGRIFVLNPDGAAQPLSAGTWTRLKPVMITPGATIIVPRDPKPFSFMESAKDLSQILSNLAVSSIYAEDLIDRN